MSEKVRWLRLTVPVVPRRLVDVAQWSGRDFMNLDLEDSVPQHLRGYARGLVQDAIANVSRCGGEGFSAS